MEVSNNSKRLKEVRKSLRARLTPAEATLWRLLKSKQLEGRKFRRQHSVDSYILDFYCPQEHLAIELDGAGHFTATGMLMDAERDQHLEKAGIRVLRFENREIFEHPEMVLEAIKACFSE